MQAFVSLARSVLFFFLGAAGGLHIFKRKDPKGDPKGDLKKVKYDKYDQVIGKVLIFCIYPSYLSCVIYRIYLHFLSRKKRECQEKATTIKSENQRPLIIYTPTEGR